MTPFIAGDVTRVTVPVDADARRQCWESRPAEAVLARGA
jgi:hypothetical protein